MVCFYGVEYNQAGCERCRDLLSSAMWRNCFVVDLSMVD